MSLRFTAAAEIELQEAAAWYDDQRIGLGTQFLDACARVFSLIEIQPDRYSRLETVRSQREFRRCVLKKFSYVIIYEAADEGPVVLAIAQAGRRSNYWIRRVRMVTQSYGRVDVT